MQFVRATTSHPPSFLASGFRNDVRRPFSHPSIDANSRISPNRRCFAPPVFVPLSKELSIPLVVFENRWSYTFVHSLENRSPFAVISSLRIRRWNLRTLLRLGPGYWSLVFLYGAGLGHGLLGWTLHHRRGSEFTEFLVDRHPVVVESGRLQDDARGTHQNCQSEDPKEQAIQHHRHVLPIFLYLHREMISLI